MKRELTVWGSLCGYRGYVTEIRLRGVVRVGTVIM